MGRTSRGRRGGGEIRKKKNWILQLRIEEVVHIGKSNRGKLKKRKTIIMTSERVC